MKVRRAPRLFSPDERKRERARGRLRRPRRLLRTQKAKLGLEHGGSPEEAGLRGIQQSGGPGNRRGSRGEGRRGRGRKEFTETRLRGGRGAWAGWNAMPACLACLAVFTRHAEPGLSKQAARCVVQALHVPRKRAGSHVTLDPGW